MSLDRTHDDRDERQPIKTKAAGKEKKTHCLGIKIRRLFWGTTPHDPPQVVHLGIGFLANAAHDLIDIYVYVVFVQSVPCLLSA